MKCKLKLATFKIKLVNYRSDPEVLDFFNHYFYQAGPSVCGDDAQSGEGSSGSQSKPVVQVIVTETTNEEEADQEILSTVARIQELLSEGLSPEKNLYLGAHA